MKKLIFCWCTLFLLCGQLTLHAQAVEETTEQQPLPEKVYKKLKKRFSKRVFIQQIEKVKADYEKMVTRLKDYTDAEGVAIYREDTELMAAYQKTQQAYNAVLDQMIKDIDATENIVQFTFFDANNRYLVQLDEAKTIGDQFLEMGEQRLSGDTKFIPGLIKWVKAFLYPLLKKIEEIYLNHAKKVIIDQLKATKFVDWADVTA